MEINYNDGKWHGWNGGECPVHPRSVVEVRSWAGSSRTVNASLIKSWNDDSAQSQPVAFRVVKEYKEPREFWVRKFTRFDLNGNVVGYEYNEVSANEGEFKVREVIE